MAEVYLYLKVHVHWLWFSYQLWLLKLRTAKGWLGCLVSSIELFESVKKRIWSSIWSDFIHISISALSLSRGRKTFRKRRV